MYIIFAFTAILLTTGLCVVIPSCTRDAVRNQCFFLPPPVRVGLQSWVHSSKGLSIVLYSKSFIIFGPPNYVRKKHLAQKIPKK